MTNKRKNIFNWNHISGKLKEDQIKELKAYYVNYHRKCWAYKQAVKHLKLLKLLGNSLSIVFTAGGIASAIATSGVALVAVSTVSLLIQGWMKHKDLDLKIHNCIYAYQSYQYLLNEIKNSMRSGNYQPLFLHNTMNNIDNYVCDNSPIVDKFLKKYDEKFTS